MDESAGALDGCYLTEVDLNNPDACELKDINRVKGEFYSAIAKISKDNRKRLWYRQLIFGIFWNVIQTTDGGYLAVGNANGTLDENNMPLGKV